jgi:hypothetical protein
MGTSGKASSRSHGPAVRERGGSTGHVIGNSRQHAQPKTLTQAPKGPDCGVDRRFEVTLCCRAPYLPTAASSALPLHTRHRHLGQVLEALTKTTPLLERLHILRGGTRHAMFSTKLTRVAHRTPPAAVLNTQSSTVTAHFSAPCVADRRQHQRRHSSSKASYPPNNAAGSGKSAAAAKDAPVTPATADPSSLSATSAPARPKRAYKARKLRASSMSKVENHFAGLPSVESTKAWRYNGTMPRFSRLGEMIDC